MAVVPSAEVIAVIQDKYAQKKHFEKFRVPLADSRALTDEASARLIPLANASSSLCASIQSLFIAQGAKFEIPLRLIRYCCSLLLSANVRGQVSAAAADFGFPLMLKARRNAYDGRGNAVAKTAADVPAALAALGGLGDGSALYAERWAPFVRELAVMVVRSRSGEVKAFPVVETVHLNNICHTVRGVQNPAGNRTLKSNNSSLA